MASARNADSHALALPRTTTIATLDDQLSPEEIGATLRYAEQSRSANTRDGYAADWKGFTRWCSERGAIPLLAMGTDANARADAAVALAAEATRISDDLRARIERTDTALSAERMRADALRERIADLQGEQAAVTGDLEREVETLRQRAGQVDDLQVNLAAARSRAEQAEADAAKLREAEIRQRARGLVARLRAAWRGE